MKGKLVIFSAPSGSGKTSIVRHLLDLDLGLRFSISATSRRPRGTEIHGQDYYFLSPQDFKMKIENKEFLEWEEVYKDQYYGTLKSEVERIWSEGKHALFDIDVKGGVNLKKAYGEHALAVFVAPPSLDVLAERLRKRRTDDEASLKKRLDKAAYELSFSVHFDRVIVNDSLKKAQQEAEELIRNFLAN